VVGYEATLLVLWLSRALSSAPVAPRREPRKAVARRAVPLHIGIGSADSNLSQALDPPAQDAPVRADIEISVVKASKILALSLVALATLGSASAAAAAPPAKPCANTYGGDVIGARIVGCAEARDVVRTWAVRYRRDGRPTRPVFRFRCHGRNDQYEGLTMHCRRPDGATVHWYANVPA
jgi:hypothetical protein